jgi:hypothetical protein
LKKLKNGWIAMVMIVKPTSSHKGRSLMKPGRPFKLDRSPKKVPSDRDFREKIVPYYEEGHTLRETADTFHMCVRTLSREIRKFTTVRKPGVQPGYRRKKRLPLEPDTSAYIPAFFTKHHESCNDITRCHPDCPTTLTEAPVNREVRQGDPHPKPKKRKIINV